MNHRWTESDDLAALYVSKFGVEHLHYSTDDPIEEIAKSKEIKPGSFRMRIQNFRALDGKKGLENYAKQSKDIFERYRNLSEPELRRLAFPELS